MNDAQLLIAPRLVPQPLWGHSACGLLRDDGRQGEWRSLRAVVLKEADSTCATCGHQQSKWMFCDEVWQYDAGQRLALLAALRILCPACNAVCHIGRTLTAEGQAAYDDALRHMARVNGTSIDRARLVVELEFESWERLSHIRPWEVRVAPELSSRFPALRVVERELDPRKPEKFLRLRRRFGRET